MNRLFGWLVAMLLCTVTVMAQDDHIADGLASVATIAGETETG